LTSSDLLRQLSQKFPLRAVFEVGSPSKGLEQPLGSFRFALDRLSECDRHREAWAVAFAVERARIVKFVAAGVSASVGLRFSAPSGKHFW